MNTNVYTTEMTKLALIAAAATVALALMMPTYAHAKAKGDTIGAPTKEVMTGASHADMADAPLPPAYFYSAKVATTTHKMTKSEKRVAIKELKAEIKRLQKQIKALTK